MGDYRDLPVLYHADPNRRSSGLWIEIGSTRENVAGQGSTRIIADFCQSSNFDFITVDMDPHNTAAAGAMFKKLGVGFQAVNDKGEDFLRAYADEMDFVFLDASDFDHGQNSELRNSGHQKFLERRAENRRAGHEWLSQCRYRW